MVRSHSPDANAKSPKNGSESGQAIIEYILLLSVLVGAFMILETGLKRLGIGAALLAPISDSFKWAYKYGHPKARGYDEGEPKNHPRTVQGENDFRIFITREGRKSGGNK